MQRRADRRFFGMLNLLLTLGNSFGNEKMWLPDLEWQTGSNWIGGHPPDAKSRVDFPENTPYTAGLPNSGHVRIAEIDLPRQGSLYLGLNGALTFSETTELLKIVEWSKKGIYMWVDPDNWDGYTRATPHAERIPCDNDIVVLPSKNRTLSLTLPKVDMRVQAVKIANENTTLNRWEWTQLAERSRRYLKTRSTVTYAPSMLRICNDCTCHSGTDEAVSEQVCAHMWRAGKCAPPVCKYPLKVEGHCCDYCGGRVSLSDKASLRKVEARVSETLENYKSLLTWHVRKMWDGNTEVLIAGRESYDGTISREAVDVLAETLIGAGFKVSEKMVAGAAIADSSLNNVLGPLLGPPVILALIMLVAFPYFGYSHSQMLAGWREACSSIRLAGGSEMTWKPSGGFFNFARFENVAEGDVTLEEDTSAASTTTESAARTTIEADPKIDDRYGISFGSKRFENPLYRSKRERLSQREPTGDRQEVGKIIDIDSPVSLAALETPIEPVPLDSSK